MAPHKDRYNSVVEHLTAAEDITGSNPPLVTRFGLNSLLNENVNIPSQYFSLKFVQQVAT